MPWTVLAFLRRATRRFRAAEPLPVETPDPVAGRERALAERLLEDEALRRDLEDASWQPLQDWLLRAAARLAESTRGLDDAAAQPVLGRGASAVRSAATTLAAVAAGGAQAPAAPELEQVVAALPTAVLDPGRADAARAALRALASSLPRRSADPATLTRQLVAALDAGAPAPPAPERARRGELC